MLFFTRKFAVDPGEGCHISYKINHSAYRANLHVLAMQTSDGLGAVVFQAKRVRCHVNNADGDNG